MYCWEGMCRCRTTKSAFNTKFAKADTASLNQQATWVSAFKTNYRLASSSFWLLRRSDWFVDPIRAVDDEKLWNLLEAAKMYKRERPECYRMEFRIDVVCVVGDANRDDIQYRGQTQGEETNENRIGANAIPACGIEHYVSPFERRILAGTPWKAHYRKLRKGHYGYYRVGR